MAEENLTDSLHLKLSRELYTNARCHFIGLLSPQSKNLLTLPEAERTGGAFSDLLSEMENIKVFTMFSNRAKESLAKKLKFVAHKANDSLLKQGKEDDQALYIIVSGVVAEHYKPLETDAESPLETEAESPLETDAESPLETDAESPPVLWPEKILQKGEFFGHVDLVLNRPSTVDALTVCYSELLMLPKEDFEIARKEMEAHCTRSVHYLRTSIAISRFEWSDEEYKVLEIYSKLCTFAENEDIYSGSENDKPFWSYFVVLGECKIVRELTYVVHESGHMKLVPYQLRRELKVDKIITDCLQFEEVKQGYFFGVGESFTGNHVIASSTLECLLIPRLLLVFKNKQLLQKMAKDLTDSLPSDQQVLDNYSKLVSTAKKKVEMFRALFKDKPERLIKN